MAMIRNKANYFGNYDIALAMLAEFRTGVSESDGFELYRFGDDSIKID